MKFYISITMDGPAWYHPAMKIGAPQVTGAIFASLHGIKCQLRLLVT